MNRYRVTYCRHGMLTGIALFTVEKKRWLFGWKRVTSCELTEQEGREFIETLQRVERENDPFFWVMGDPDRE